MQNIKNVSFNELLIWNCLKVKDVCKLTGKSEKTIKKYIRTNKPAKETRLILEWLFFGVPQVPDWDGWKIRHGKIISPALMEYETKHLEMLPYLYSFISEKLYKDPHKKIEKRRILGNKKI